MRDAGSRQAGSCAPASSPPSQQRRRRSLMRDAGSCQAGSCAPASSPPSMLQTLHARSSTRRRSCLVCCLRLTGSIFLHKPLKVQSSLVIQAVAVIAVVAAAAAVVEGHHGHGRRSHRVLERGVVPGKVLRVLRVNGARGDLKVLLNERRRLRHVLRLTERCQVARHVVRVAGLRRQLPVLRHQCRLWRLLRLGRRGAAGPCAVPARHTAIAGAEADSAAVTASASAGQGRVHGAEVEAGAGRARLAAAVQLRAVPRRSRHDAGDRLHAVQRDHLLEGAAVPELMPPRAVVLRGGGGAGRHRRGDTVADRRRGGPPSRGCWGRTGGRRAPPATGAPCTGRRRGRRGGCRPRAPAQRGRRRCSGATSPAGARRALRGCRSGRAPPPPPSSSWGGSSSVRGSGRAREVVKGARGGCRRHGGRRRGEARAVCEPTEGARRFL
ncbi:atherin isoform X1 [Triticum aestivum]|uniref:atherin isoform X1 n=1 Tax=Triticum aestivum TaxID=4565 RepID=UPI001D01C1F5|nr:atherin-like isoform X1 [Triticum aestivum]